MPDKISNLNKYIKDNWQNFTFSDQKVGLFYQNHNVAPLNAPPVLFIEQWIVGPNSKNILIFTSKPIFIWLCIMYVIHNVRTDQGAVVENLIGRENAKSGNTDVL